MLFNVTYREAQTKFIEESVKKVEKYFGLMCNDMGSVSRKNGRLRDKYDELAKVGMPFVKCLHK